LSLEESELINAYYTVAGVEDEIYVEIILLTAISRSSFLEYVLLSIFLIILFISFVN